MKMKYDESDNTLIRASRAVTDKMTGLIGESRGLAFVCSWGVIRGVRSHPDALLLWSLGGLFSKTEMSEVLTEIIKVDPSFDKDSFLKLCERDIIPNILEVRFGRRGAKIYRRGICGSPETKRDRCRRLSWCVFKAGAYAVSMQAMIQGELEVLKDWCYEAVCRPHSVILEHF